MQRTVSDHVVFPGVRFCSTWWNHTAFRVFRVLIWEVCVFRLFVPSLDHYLGIFTVLIAPATILVGILLLTIGFGATVLIHFYMGSQWRSGIDPHGPKRIISTGIYGFSRHPIFVAVALSQLGFFLALPSLFSLLCLVIGLYTLNRQAIAEEKHLMQSSKADYQSYCCKVRGGFELVIKSPSFPCLDYRAR